MCVHVCMSMCVCLHLAQRGCNSNDREWEWLKSKGHEITSIVEYVEKKKLLVHC